MCHNDSLLQQMGPKIHTYNMATATSKNDRLDSEYSSPILIVILARKI